MYSMKVVDIPAYKGESERQGVREMRQRHAKLEAEARGQGSTIGIEGLR